MDRLSCTACEVFGNCPDRFRQFSGPKLNKTTWMGKPISQENGNDKFRLVQKSTMGVPDLKQRMKIRSRLFVAADIFRRKQNLSPVEIPNFSEDLYEKLKLAQIVAEFSDRANRKLCVTLVWYKVDKPRNSYSDVRIIARKKDDDKFQQNVYVSYALEDFIYLFDTMTSVYCNVFTNKPFCSSLWKTYATNCSSSFCSVRVRLNWNNEDNTNQFPKLKSKLGLYHVVLTTLQTSPE